MPLRRRRRHRPLHDPQRAERDRRTLPRLRPPLPPGPRTPPRRLVLPACLSRRLSPCSPGREAPPRRCYIELAGTYRSWPADRTNALGVVLDGGRATTSTGVDFRSVVVDSTARLVPPEERCHAFEVLVDHVIPGRWHDTRRPNQKELAGVQVVSVGLGAPATVTAKSRVGDQSDDKDAELDYWAGIVPVRLARQAPDQP
ncbi:pyridoxamine 5'-phosphate oxidase family protein [Streptomyces sp. AV19]|nr:pyridoxamine 5'-phosphate oxidase family protein [Streptomyces sp. AV19]